MPRTKTERGDTRVRRRYAKRLQPADRREQLLDAALELVAERGFTAVSIAAVAERGGVTRPVVYDSFGSRDELLRELIDRETRRMGEAVHRSLASIGSAPTEDVPEALSAGLVRFLDEVRAMPRTWRLVYFPIDGVPPVLRERVERARTELRAPLRLAVGAWLAGTDEADQVDVDVMVRLVQGLIQTFSRLVLDDPEHFDVDRIVGLLGELLFREP
ncbi:TetR/AcrR family transcriptional regulator [Nocardia sp. NPDC052566]|uniref:TetR/AcrR family transcriptional regulator n=1 Tax=Nocardia sp. NPDC052566 TaxID=3364330 RepID=UPI0037C9D2FF